MAFNNASTARMELGDATFYRRVQGSGSLGAGFAAAEHYEAEGRLQSRSFLHDVNGSCQRNLYSTSNSVNNNRKSESNRRDHRSNRHYSHTICTHSYKQYLP